MNNYDIYEAEDLKESIKEKIEGILKETDKISEKKQINFLIVLYKNFEGMKEKIQKEVYKINKKN